MSSILVGNEKPVTGVEHRPSRAETSASLLGLDALISIVQVADQNSITQIRSSITVRESAAALWKHGVSIVIATTTRSHHTLSDAFVLSP
jgi:hypothetical protein